MDKNISNFGNGMIWSQGALTPAAFECTAHLLIGNRFCALRGAPCRWRGCQFSVNTGSLS